MSRVALKKQIPCPPEKSRVTPIIRVPCAPGDPGMALKKQPPSHREHSRMFPKKRPSILQKDRIFHSRYGVLLLHIIRGWQTRNGILVIQSNRGWHTQSACPGCVPQIFRTTGKPFLDCPTRNFTWKIEDVFSEPPWNFPEYKEAVS
jgi:hypothetical protein